MKRIFILLGILFSIHTVFSQNIVKAEYFLDVDTSQGNGTAIPGVTPGDVVNFSFTIPTTGLSNGFHFLNIRVADINGVWSRYETRTFYLSSTTVINTTNISGAEYFIDSVPAPSNGMPVNIGSPGSVVNFPIMIPASLSSGFHFLGVRVKDQEGKWSLYEQRGFYIPSVPVNAPPIVAAEYFYDVDPGIGSASPLTVNPIGDTIIQTFPIPVPLSLSQGDHLLAIRVKDQAGSWSFFAKDTITVSNSTTITCPGNKNVNALTGQCSAVVNNIDPVVTPQSSFTYTLTGATTGSGNGTASGLTFNAGTTTVTYALANSPSTNCSFTVTVNTNVVPTVNINTATTSICIGTQVTFTAVPTNGGSPTYTWKKNGTVVGTGSTFQTSALADQDQVKAEMTSSLGCANPQTVTSNIITMSVGAAVTPAVSINASATSICTGMQVTFTAVPTNGGSPTYTWKKNGTVVGTGSTFQTSALTDQDQVKAEMTSSLGCANPQTVTSNVITMSVGATVTPAVSINASATSICIGTEVTFTAVPTNGGSPTYTWKKNGTVVGTGSTFQTSVLADQDQVKAEMTSSLSCASPQTVTSNIITMTVGTTVTPTVSINATATSICTGTQVTFTSTSTNGGSPSYVWKRNGTVVSMNPTFVTSILSDQDEIKLEMTSSLGCANPQTVTSNIITMSVGTTVTPNVSVFASETSICSGTLVTFNAISSNGGNPSYVWKHNGTVVGTGTTWQSSALVNQDEIKAEMTSSLSCASPQTVTSNIITMTVGTTVTPTVSINATATSICTGTQVTFTSTSTNGGSPSYVWKRNGTVVSMNPTFVTSILSDQDEIKLEMTSSLGCASPQTVTSNIITMSVGTTVTPNVSVFASETSICSGTQVTFTSTSSNGGNPTYTWKRNGTVVGTGTTWQSSTLVNQDEIKAEMTSSLSCASPQTVTSNIITMTVGTTVTPTVSINATATSICTGTQVTFTSTSTNGGSPSYVWKRNGTVVSMNPTFVTSILSDQDEIKLEMTSSLGCASPQTVTSNIITMSVGTTVTPNVSVFASETSICSGSLVTFNATSSNGGNPTYTWRQNGTVVGTGTTWQSSNLSDQDQVKAEMTSSLGCASPQTVTSNIITMSVSPGSTLYRDQDGDGYGDINSAIQVCTSRSGYVTNNTDCNDNNSAVNPGQAEICGNGIDDNCNGTIDENCTTSLPVLTLRTYPAKEGDAGQTVLNVTVTLDKAASTPASVHYATANEDATAGLDYVATSGTLVIPAGSTSGTIQVRIIGDLLKETNERFRINFTNPVNVSINGDPYSRIMIIDDDKGKNNSITSISKVPAEDEQLKIPSVTQQNQVWFIQQIGNYENEVSILNTQGQLVTRFVNYRNQTPVGNLPSGLYFYSIQIKQRNGQSKHYTGRLMITQ